MHCYTCPRLAGFAEPVPGTDHLRLVCAEHKGPDARPLAATIPLYSDPAVTCSAIVAGDDGDADWCHEMSQFVVERSDGDTSYGAGGGTEEACDAHLADAVVGMIDGDDHVHAVVKLRWDRPEAQS